MANMDRVTQIRALASTLAVVTLVLKTSAAADVVLPCPAFAPGNSWQSSMTTPMGPTIISTTVLSSDGKKILVGEKTTIKLAIPGMPDGPGIGSPVTNSVTAEYEKHGSTTVRSSIEINGTRTSYEPPEPICGALPSQWTVATKNTTPGGTMVTQATVTARSLGTEKITVPAGTFDATVVEVRRQDRPSALSPGSESVHVIYAVESVGFLKIMVSISMPHPAVAQQTDTKAVRNQVVTELQSFAVK